MASPIIPVRSGDLLTAQSAKALHRLITTQSSLQLVAAADAAGEVLVTLALAPIVGVVSLEVGLEAALGTGESVTYTVSKLNASRTSFTTVASFVVDDTTVAGPVDASSGLVTGVEFEVGDIIYVSRAYVPGAGATTPANSVTIQFE